MAVAAAAVAAVVAGAAAVERAKVQRLRAPPR
jgi:hypothetical protein